ncbi:hypothetical protein B0A48_08233 [Cryoendolithus antarcticus]|uniref:Uncharacterized protein n=1 Tax=Cryoendolithus antarcticus TaxID=1507870 RepID=A0A1V8T523_9PEZI|nr:hypothetical protein B0A48_08233 [Cryoendolithus antarcticus]
MEAPTPPNLVYTPRYSDRSYFNAERKAINLTSEVIGHLRVDCELRNIRLYNFQEVEEEEAVVLQLQITTTRDSRSYVTWADVQLQFGEQESELNLTHCEPNTIKGNNQARHVITHYNFEPNITAPAGGASFGNAERTTDQIKISSWKFECSRKSDEHPKGHYQHLRLALFVPNAACSESFSERSLVAAAVLDVAAADKLTISSSVIDGKASSLVDKARCFRKWFLKSSKSNVKSFPLAKLRAQGKPALLESPEKLEDVIGRWVYDLNAHHAPMGTDSQPDPSTSRPDAPA